MGRGLSLARDTKTSQARRHYILAWQREPSPALLLEQHRVGVTQGDAVIPWDPCHPTNHEQPPGHRQWRRWPFWSFGLLGPRSVASGIIIAVTASHEHAAIGQHRRDGLFVVEGLVVTWVRFFSFYT